MRKSFVLVFLLKFRSLPEKYLSFFDFILFCSFFPFFNAFTFFLPLSLFLCLREFPEVDLALIEKFCITIAQVDIWKRWRKNGSIHSFKGFTFQLNKTKKKLLVKKKGFAEHWNTYMKRWNIASFDVCEG